MADPFITATIVTAVDPETAENVSSVSAEIAADTNAEWVGKAMATILSAAMDKGLDPAEINQSMMQAFAEKANE